MADQHFIHICAPDAVAVIRKVTYCPMCCTRRRFTLFDNGYRGTDMICHYCGVLFWPGEASHQRPTKVSTARNRARARAGWAAPYDHTEQWFTEMTEAAVADETS